MLLRLTTSIFLLGAIAFASSGQGNDLAKVMDYAKAQIGTKTYKYGCPDNRNCKSSQIDCSYFTQQAFAKVGIEIPRVSSQQEIIKRGTLIKNSRDLQAGDLIFFQSRGLRVGHVGIVTENKNGMVRFIHASIDNNGIAINKLEGNWKRIFTSGRRILNGNPTTAPKNRVTLKDLPDISKTQMNSFALEKDGITIARLFEFKKYGWRYIGRKPNVANDPRFSVQAYLDRIDHEKENNGSRIMIQLAGPFTNANGSTQGLSVENGITYSPRDSGKSGIVIVKKDGEMQIVHRDFITKKWGSLSKWRKNVLEKNGHSMFQQSLVINDGKIHPDVINRWRIYKNNIPNNYRLLVILKNKKKGVIDFHRGKQYQIGFQDALKTLKSLDVKYAIYLDVGKSEFGTYMAPNQNNVAQIHYLGGGDNTELNRSSKIYYDDTSPGGLLEFIVEK